jgi:hypothetical protein
MCISASLKAPSKHCMGTEISTFNEQLSKILVALSHVSLEYRGSVINMSLNQLEFLTAAFAKQATAAKRMFVVPDWAS